MIYSSVFEEQTGKTSAAQTERSHVNLHGINGALLLSLTRGEVAVDIDAEITPVMMWLELQLDLQTFVFKTAFLHCRYNRPWVNINLIVDSTR